MKKQNKLKSFRTHLDEKYGKEGSHTRNEYEAGFEVFRLGVIMQELRKKNGLTQEEVANRCGTTKSYISRIENNASDIRLSTIIRIFKQGFGKDLRLTVN